MHVLWVRLGYELRIEALAALALEDREAVRLHDRNLASAGSQAFEVVERALGVDDLKFGRADIGPHGLAELLILAVLLAGAERDLRLGRFRRCLGVDVRRGGGEAGKEAKGCEHGEGRAQGHR